MTGAKSRHAQLSMKIFRWVRRSFKKLSRLNTLIRLLNCVEFLPGDRYGAVTDLSLAPPEEFFADGEDDIPSPGWYEISWRR